MFSHLSHVVSESVNTVLMMVGLCLPLKNTIIICDYLSALYIFAFQR